MADTRRLPVPTAAVWDWQLRGACRGKDPSVFFHPENERGAVRAARERAAKAVCARCPVIRECYETALRVQEPYGVWGGTTERERADIIAGRRRVQPPQPHREPVMSA